MAVCSRMSASLCARASALVLARVRARVSACARAPVRVGAAYGCACVSLRVRVLPSACLSLRATRANLCAHG